MKDAKNYVGIKNEGSVMKHMKTHFMYNTIQCDIFCE